jgi:DNA polymerase III sliding clamp (beta) subunit (PCNA family)
VSIAAALSSKNRPALESIVFESEAGHLRLTACDGHSLAFADLPVDYSGPAVVVPVSLVSEVRRRLPPKQDILLVWNKGFYASWPGVEMAGAVIAETYPNYRALFPSEFPHKAVFNRVELTETIRRVTSITPADADTTLVLSLKENAADFQLVGVVEGTSSDTVECAHDGEPPPIGLVPKTISEALRCLNAETITLNYDDPQKVLELQGTPDYHFYTMPLALSKRDLGQLYGE